MSNVKEKISIKYCSLGVKDCPTVASGLKILHPGYFEYSQVAQDWHSDHAV